MLNCLLEFESEINALTRHMDKVLSFGHWICIPPTIRLYSRSFYQNMILDHMMLYGFQCPSYHGSLAIDTVTAWTIIQEKTGDSHQNMELLSDAPLSLLHKKILSHFFEEMIEDFSPHHKGIGLMSSLGTCDFVLDISFIVHTPQTAEIHLIIEKPSQCGEKKINLQHIPLRLIASTTTTITKTEFHINDQILISNSPLYCDITYNGRIFFKGELGKKNDHFAIKIVEKIDE